jgi:CheY-specific phosphatase CheX
MIHTYETLISDSITGGLGRIIRSEVVRRLDVTVHDATQRKNVAVSVRLLGDPGGMVLLRMHSATAVKMCSRLNNTSFDALTPLAADTLLEVANMLAGRVTCILNNQGFAYTLSIPRLGVRENSAEHVPKLKGLCIPLMTDYGDLAIHVALKEK